jgi:TPR repeat protein
MYENGDGFKSDARQAAKFYQQACEGGNARGCAYLGDIYMHGNGAAKDQGRAEQLYQRACDKGYAEGCTNLSKLKGKP